MSDFNGALDRYFDEQAGYYDEPEEDETSETDPLDTAPTDDTFPSFRSVIPA
jgi:hypothetical protein